MIKIFNTLSGKKEILKKPARGPIRLFVCGPTVYNEIHLGNFRTYLCFDIIVRYLRSQKLKISYLQNITNLDDKIIIRAAELKMTPALLADKYEQLFYEHLKRLNITSVNTFARATDHIPEVIKQVQTLIKKGYAYFIQNDGWYFDLSKFSDYGKLSGRTVAQAEDGVSRIDASDKKRNAGDFCLWKISKPGLPAQAGEPSWESDLGAGRPGWHIEDTAITEEYFGPQYEIHGAGRDLIFPHHEAEIAQQESASGKKPFVKLWMHVGFLTVAGEKMSKSLNNFTSTSELLEKHTADSFRFLVLQHYYRASFDYSETAIRTAAQNLSNIAAFLIRLEMVAKIKNKKPIKINLQKSEKDFQEAMADDFNTPKALAVLFDLINAVNKKIWELTPKEAKSVSVFMKKTLTMLGIQKLIPIIPPDIKRMAQSRELFRISKQFIQSDDLRRQIEGLGYTIEDTPAGPLVLPK